MAHSGIIFQLGYNSGHISNPFSPLFYPHHYDCPAHFHLIWPRINNQKILDPVCSPNQVPKILKREVHYNLCNTKTINIHSRIISCRNARREDINDLWYHITATSISLLIHQTYQIMNDALQNDTRNLVNPKRWY